MSLRPIILGTLVLDVATADVHRRPHVIAILADDIGWANVGWHREAGYDEVQTPVMDSLVADGIELDRFYAYKFCSPSRSAAQSGREAIHVNAQMGTMNVNPMDPVSGYSGIPRNMTTIATVMRDAGYHTVFAGKWDVGMATMEHTPHGRGYEESLLYFNPHNNFWTEDWVWDCERAENNDMSVDCEAVAFNEGSCVTDTGIYRPIDLWHNVGPAQRKSGDFKRCSVGSRNTCLREEGDQCPPYPGYPGKQVSDCQYEDDLFTEVIIDAVKRTAAAAAHKPHRARPLFAFWSPHIAHSPLQVPKESLDRFAHIDDWRRARYAAMVYRMDTQIGQVVDLLKSTGLWNDTVILFSSDNGGPVYRNGDSGANNWPLRGGKAANFEGGIRSAAFASGGFLPESRHGLKLDGLAGIWDWYATFAHLAGVDDISDPRAAAAGLPDVDSLNLWPYLIGKAQESPRKEIAIGTNMWMGKQVMWGAPPSNTVVVGMIVDNRTSPTGGLWKYLIDEMLMMDGWQGPEYPNATFTWYVNNTMDCSHGGGCLFRLDVDETEHHDVRVEFPDVVEVMHSRLVAHNATVFSPDRGLPDNRTACAVALDTHAGFWGPFLADAFHNAHVV